MKSIVYGAHCPQRATTRLLLSGSAACVLLAVVLATYAAPDDRLLLHWTFDEGTGTQTADGSGNHLPGTIRAAWTSSPAGTAVEMDGTPRSLVSVQLPEDMRFGRESWTFTAMLKPTQFDINEPQRQRRIFSYGTYPAAYLVIDISDRGLASCYFCYTDKDAQTISTGGATSIPLVKNRWSHLALVCDRSAGQIRIFVNGYCASPTTIRKGFDGDYVLGGQLTIGSSWHNYWGLVDEVKIHRAALSTHAIRAEFDRLQPIFDIVESEEGRQAKERERQMQALETAGAAWNKKQFATVRTLCEDLCSSPAAPAHLKSYAHLRIAQSFLAENRTGDALAVYKTIAATSAYPAPHRFEASECVVELERRTTGLPPRDPEASRTTIPSVQSFVAEFFVSADGDDQADGSATHPFATLRRARDEIRAVRARGIRGAAAITASPGEYRVTETLALGTEDSGTAESPVVYRAREKGTAVLYGGMRLTGFKPVTDPAVNERLPATARGNVWECSLGDNNVHDFGALAVRGFAQPPPPPTLELYVDGAAMTLARWPNDTFVGIRELIEEGSRAEGKPSVFEYDSDRHARWLRAEDPWLFGYFHFLWADATIKVGAIDPTTRTLTTAAPYHYGGRGMSRRQGIQYYAFNLLEEIDRPGEWYLNRNTGMLYLYPATDPLRSTAEIGMHPSPMMTLNGVRHVRIEGLVFDLARDTGIVARDCSDILMLGCTVSRMAGNGIEFKGGRKNRLIGCDIHTIGRRATEVSGGDRAALTPGEHLVENCRIHDFGRIDRTYTPAIQLEGVGHRVAHNLMYNCPSSVMRIEGNDHVIEFNEVHSAVQESDDQGAMELFRNPTYRGNIFRYNYYHHIGKTGAEKAVHGQAAIRFDDAISGMLVYGNIFYRCANGNFGAIQMNSGRDNVMDNNVFVDCKQGISGGWNAGNNVWKMLAEGKKDDAFFSNEHYLRRYPQIKTMLDPPGINHVWRNVFCGCGKVATRVQNLDLFANAVFEDTDPGFVNAKDGNFRLRPDAPLLVEIGFKPIPVDEIGLYASPYRASWPVHALPAQVRDWRDNK